MARLSAGRTHERDAPYGVNLIVHKSNPRMAADLAEVVKHKVPATWVPASSPRRKPVCSRSTSRCWWNHPPLTSDNLQHEGGAYFGEELTPTPRPRKDIWSGGQGTGQIHDLPSAGELYARMIRQYDDTCRELADGLAR
jgi:hypothetical protein